LGAWSVHAAQLIDPDRGWARPWDQAGPAQ